MYIHHNFQNTFFSFEWKTVYLINGDMCSINVCYLISCNVNQSVFSVLYNFFLFSSEWVWSSRCHWLAFSRFWHVHLKLLIRCKYAKQFPMGSLWNANSGCKQRLGGCRFWCNKITEVWYCSYLIKMWKTNSYVPSALH